MSYIAPRARSTSSAMRWPSFAAGIPAKTRASRARRRRRHQPGTGLVDQQDLRQEPAAALFRQSLRAGDPRGRRRARRGLPSRVRRAGTHRQRRAPRPRVTLSLRSFPRKRESRGKELGPRLLARGRTKKDPRYYSSTCSGRRTVLPEAAARSIAMVVSRLMRACSGVV